jgi:hypothetical protein
MHSREEVRLVQHLAAEGLNTCQIARRAEVPRTTVRDWIAGRLPKHGMSAEDSCAECGHPAHEPARLPAPIYAYAFAMYLGDGCLLRHPRGVWRLDVALDSRYPGIIAECAGAVGAIMPASRVSVTPHPPDRYKIVRSYSKGWPCLFPQHGAGPKHRRSIALEPWQQVIVDAQPEAFIRGLIHSDGCRVRNRVNGKDYPRYHFTQVSDDIRRLFCRSLSQLGIRYTWNDARNVSIARRPDVARLDEFVGPKR